MPPRCIDREDPVNPILETRTFEKEFTVVGTVLSAVLDIATDNSYRVFIDDVEVAADPSENNFQLLTQDNYDLSGVITSGTHTLSVEVTNHPGSNNPQNNPAGLLYKLQIESEKCKKGDVSVHNKNGAAVFNHVGASANTGGNNASGASGGSGGDGGDIDNDGNDVEDSTTGNGGAGGDADGPLSGGLVDTGDAGARAGVMNVVNTNVVRSSSCGDCCGCGGDVDVRNRNRAFVGNHVDADANSGDNNASGAEGGSGGGGGDIDNDDGDDVDDSDTGNGGAGGDGGEGGTVFTGVAVSEAGAVNVVNKNRTRIRR